VGETGFNTYEPNGYVSPACTSLCCPGTPLACDTPKVDCSGTVWNSAFFDGDATHPTYFDQQDYYADNLEMVRNCGAQGYAVWEYQDGLSADCSNKFGLLYNGNTDPANLANILKPAAAEFTNYLDAQGQPPPAVPLTAPPNNYYDPMHTAAYTQFGSANDISGTVTDLNNVPVKDAFLRAHTFMHPHPITGFPIDNVFYTFTNADASQNFTLTPFDPEDPSIAALQYIRWLEVTSIGSSNIEDGQWGDYPGCNGCPDPYHQVQSGQTFTLNKIDLNLNSTVENQTVNSGNSPATFQAWRTLTVTTNNTVQSGGTADFKALDEVNVESEFHAENGSEVHIYNETVLLDCGDISGFRMIHNPSSPPYVSSENKSMELIFRIKNLPESVSVFPNPNVGIFTLNYTGNSDDVKQINVYDIIGNIIISGNFTGNENELNLTAQPKGIYFLEVKSKTNVFNQKIIIQ
jgi:type IX secretion system substrate protein